MLKLYMKALFKRSNHIALTQFRHPVLPQRIYSRTLGLSRAHYDAYCDSIAWSDTDCVHPCYLQVATMSLQLKCLLDKDSPFAAVGLVHVSNTIRVLAQCDLEQSVECRVRFSAIKPHRQGWVLSLTTEVFQNGKGVYICVSDYLSRVKAVHVAAGKSETEKEVNSEQSMKVVDEFHVNEITARRYARISGDYNPIHLHALTSRLFGFNQPIAHGMWSLARTISALNKLESFNIESVCSELRCEFKKPVILPADVALLVDCNDDGSIVAELKTDDIVHLILNVGSDKLSA